MSTSSSNNKVLLKSCDGETFEVDEAAASESLTIKHMIEALKDVAEIADSAMPIPNVKSADSAMPIPNVKSADSAITVPNVTGKTLAKVIQYCKKHVLASESADPRPRAVVDDELKAFDVDFLNVDNNTLIDLVSAANYLNIKGLLDLTCQAVADKLSGKTIEEMRAEFNIVNDLTPEDIEQFTRENEWAFGEQVNIVNDDSSDEAEPMWREFQLVFIG